MLRRYFPILTWGAEYSGQTLANDLIAAIIVTVMLIPQSLAYALLAGLPPEVGLYASIAPLVVYAIFGTSRALAVGPVAVASLMTAAAVGKLAETGTPEYLGAAIALAFLSGLMLLVMGFLRLGFLANFLSHPVISGFITASGLLIAASQLKHILGIPSEGETLVEILASLATHLGQTNIFTLAIGAGTVRSGTWRSARSIPRQAGVSSTPSSGTSANASAFSRPSRPWRRPCTKPNASPASATGRSTTNTPR